MTVELERLGSVDEARADWERLATASGCPFATVEWTETWLEHAAGPYVPHLFLARDPDGRAVAIVPLVIARGRYVRKARFLGFRAANQVGAICARDDSELGVQALRQVLAATRRDWDIFVAENLPGDRLGFTPRREGDRQEGRPARPRAVGDLGRLPGKPHPQPPQRAAPQGAQAAGAGPHADDSTLARGARAGARRALRPAPRPLGR